MFPTNNKFIVTRIHNFNYEAGQLIRLDSDITDYDTDRLMFPNTFGITYKIQSGIAYLSDRTDCGHYVIWKRNGNSWKWISDDRARNYAQLSKNLKNIHLLFLQKNTV